MVTLFNVTIDMDGINIFASSVGKKFQLWVTSGKLHPTTLNYYHVKIWNKDVNSTNLER